MIYMVEFGGIALLKKFEKPRKNTKIKLDYICQCHNLLIDVWCLFLEVFIDQILSISCGSWTTYWWKNKSDFLGFVYLLANVSCCSLTTMCGKNMSDFLGTGYVHIAIGDGHIVCLDARNCIKFHGLCKFIVWIPFNISSL